MGTKTIDSVQVAQDLVGCTHVEGSLILNLRQGCEYLPLGHTSLLALPFFPATPLARPSYSTASITLGPRLRTPLPCGTHHCPCPCSSPALLSPDNLEQELQHSLGLVETITGFLKIKHSFALVSLGFFKNLKLIRGDAMVDG